jgi:hypothetical protein
VAPKKRPDAVPPNSQLTALGKRSQDGVDDRGHPKGLIVVLTGKRPTKSSPYATAAKFVDFAELFKSPKVSEVATHTVALRSA